MAEFPDDIAQALEGVRDIADSAVAMLDRYPEEYRVPILISMLVAATGRGSAMPTASVGPHPGGEAGSIAQNEVGEASGPQLDGLGVAAAAAGVDEADLKRIVQLTDEGFVRLLPRVNGHSMAERANRAVVVYCFIKEHGFEEWDVGIEELRRLCVEQGGVQPPKLHPKLQDEPLAA